jgi:putative transcriptional regulator
MPQQGELRNRLRESRLHRGFTQEELAGAVGVTRQTIISLEKGKYVPSVKLALRLAKALKISLENLFWLENSRGKRA